LAKLDTSTLKTFGNHNNLYQKWHWDGDGDVSGAPDGLTFGNLSAGVHTLVIEKREVTPIPPRLDVLCFSKSSDIAPTDEEACAFGACGVIEPPANAVCVAAGGSSPAGVFSGAMTTSTVYTGGTDTDPALDNLTTPLVFANSTSNASGENADKVSYSINVPSTATWYLWGRFYAPSTNSNGANSFFVKLDNGTLKKFDNNKTYLQKWHWGGNGDVETGTPTAISLGTVSAGFHTITVEKREVTPAPPPRLDVFCLTQDGITPPTDVDACILLGTCP
jgi:hypothetical protein